MGIKEGTITEMSQEFYLEPLFEDAEVNTKLINVSNNILADGDTNNVDIDIPNVGSFNGGWDFWDNLSYTEKNSNFDFKPLFCKPDFKLQLSNYIEERYNLENSETTARILYYPFGLVVVRFRIYFEFRNETSVDEFINFEKSIRKDIKASFDSDIPEWTELSGSLIQNLFRPINDWMFTRRTPNEYRDRRGDRRVTRVLHLYTSTDLEDSDKSKLIRGDNRDRKDEIIAKEVSPYLGELPTDEFSVSRKGGIIQTNAFNEHQPWSRRWKRIHLLNNIYIAYDFATFEDVNAGIIRDKFSEKIDDLNRLGFTNPITAKQIKGIEAALQSGKQFRQIRGRVYEQLEPTDRKNDIMPDIDENVNRLLNHETIIEKSISSLTNPLKYLGILVG